MRKIFPCLRIAGKKPILARDHIVAFHDPLRSAIAGGALTGGLPWLELVVPQPPSVNRFMGKLGNRSPIVKSWIRQADMAFVLARSDAALEHSMGRRSKVFTKIIGKFEIVITFERDKSDFHNRIKPLFDWLQRIELIQNDRLCERLVALWGPPKTGCRIKLRPFMDEELK